MLEFYSRETPIEELLLLIDRGELALPDFQRDFIWSPARVIDLLRSVSKRWPTGSFLLQETTKASFATRKIDGATRAPANPRILVLDGQQRITALYRAIRNKGTETYYVQTSVLGSDDDDAFRFMRATQFRKLFSDPRVAARDGVLSIETMYDDDLFYEWLKHVREDQQSLIRRARDESLAGLRRHVYRMPCTYLGQNIELAALAKIFETINRTGERLDVFDLVTASVYPHGLNLRESWEAAVESKELIRNFKIEGEELLRLVSLLAGTEGKTASLGVRQSDILDVRPAVIKTYWLEVVDLYEEALATAREKFGVVSRHLLPSKAMVLSLAFFIRSRRPHAQIERWWWYSCMAQTYAQGANTQVLTDIQKLRDHSASVTAEMLMDARRRNEILTRSLCAFLWMTGTRPVIGARAETWDVAPLALLPPFPDNDLDPVSNYTLADAPKRRASLMESHPDVLPSKEHKISLSLYKKRELEEFGRDRAERIAKLVRETFK